MDFQKIIFKKLLPIATSFNINNKKTKQKTMKKVIISAIAMAFVFASCSTDSTKSETATGATTTETAANTTSTEQLYACPMHPEVMGKKGEKCSKCGMELTEPVKETAATSGQLSNTAIDEVVANYLKLKNALVKDNTKEAANAGDAIVVALGKIDMKKMSEEQMKGYMDVADDAKENAEHIGANAGKLDHQREHFALLSKDIDDLIKTFGSSQKLYQDFCPMYDENKGAIWISEIKEIENPYFGSKMISCGSVKKEL
jgi:hypothetical protein